mgnify:FL=1
MKERTYVMLKPDGVRKHLLLEVIKRFEQNNLMITNLKEMKLTEELIYEHYAHVSDKPFFPKLEEYMLSGPVIAMIIEGEDAVNRVRKLMGPTNCKEALPGTIRGDYGNKDDENCRTYNVIHGSDSVENAEIEVNRFFPELKEKNKSLKKAIR